MTRKDEGHRDRRTASGDHDSRNDFAWEETRPQPLGGDAQPEQRPTVERPAVEPAADSDASADSQWTPDTTCELSQVDQTIRINELKERAREAGGGEMDDWTSETCPLDLQEAFWESVLAWETAPDSTYAEMLSERNVPLPPPELLNEQELHAALWEVIRGLRDINVYLVHTNHLSDRQLYEFLWGDVMRQPTKHVPDTDLWHCELDLLGGCSQADLRLLRTYYPQDWGLGEWDETALGPPPQQQPAPFDRDHLLPREPED